MSSSHGFVLDPTIDYSVYVPADPLPAYVPPAFTPTIDYSQPEPITWAPTSTYVPPTLVQPEVGGYSGTVDLTAAAPTPVADFSSVDINSPASWTAPNYDQPVSFAGFETVYDDNGADTGSFIYTGVSDPGAPPMGPAAQAAVDTGAAAGALAAGGVGVATAIGSLFGLGVPTGIVVGTGVNALMDNIKQGAQDWQYPGALQGTNGGIMGTNSNLDLFDNPPVDQDPFNRLTPTFQWNGSDNSNWFSNDNLNAGYGSTGIFGNNMDIAPVATYSNPTYTVPSYTMPDYMGGQGAFMSWADNTGGAGGGALDFASNDFSFDTMSFGFE